jgi:hypothetical protein
MYIRQDRKTIVFKEGYKMRAQDIKVIFTDICNTISFAFDMARDVSSYFREKRRNETLCLELS